MDIRRFGCFTYGMAKVKVDVAPSTGASTATRVRVARRRRGEVGLLNDVVMHGAGPLELRHGRHGAPVPAEIAESLRIITEAVSAGRSVSIVVEGDASPPRRKASPAVEVVMSSQQAADLLNVSRPYVVKLAKQGLLPVTQVGNRHRFKRSDVLAYKSRMERTRATALSALTPAGGYVEGDF